MAYQSNNYKEFLETNAFLDPLFVSSNLKPFLTTDVVGEERDNLLIEIKCFDFFFQNGSLRPIMESVDKDGKIVSYPDLNAFTQEEINYINLRANESSHPFLISRYSHLLWLIKKHNSFAENAINNYSLLAKLYFENSLKGKNLYHKFSSVIECYHLISVTIKYKVEECKAVILKWIDNKELPTGWKDNLLDIIIDSPVFRRDDILGLTEKMVSLIRTSDLEYHIKETFLNSCLRLSQKEGVPTIEIFNLLGDNQMTLVEEGERDESGMILMSAYHSAAHYYRMASNLTKYNQILDLYTKQKEKLQLGLFQYEFPPEQVQQMNEQENLIIDKILSNTEIDPLWFLVHNNQILINETDLTAEASERMEGSFLSLVTTTVYDLNNNPRELKDKDEKLEHQKFQSYSIKLQVTVISLIEKLLYKAVRTGRHNRESIMAFFNKTWLSNELREFSGGGPVITFSWMQLLGPGLHEILSQLETQILDKKYQPNFLLGIDSLTIKIEAVIRDLARLAGMSVTKIKEYEAVEMNLEDLLNDKEVQSLFKEEDILLWKYLLTNKGWNYRNNIAHSFYRPSDYNRQKAILLLFVVFRLCKYGDLFEHKQ